MDKKIVVRTTLVTLLAMVLLAPFSAALASPPPESWYWEGSGTDPGLLDCGNFIIDGEWSAWERGRVFFDNDGNPVGINLHYHFLGKLTNRATGLTVRDERSFTVKVDFANHTQTVSGAIWNLNVPGHGVVALDAGTLVFDTTTLEILHEGGLHQVLHGLDVWGPDGVLCTYMDG